MNRILLWPGARGRNPHKDERQEEFYLVLEGTLSLAIEGVERDMGTGEHLGRDVLRWHVSFRPRAPHRASSTDRSTGTHSPG